MDLYLVLLRRSEMFIGGVHRSLRSGGATCGIALLKGALRGCCVGYKHIAPPEQSTSFR